MERSAGRPAARSWTCQHDPPILLGGYSRGTLFTCTLPSLPAGAAGYELRVDATVLDAPAAAQLPALVTVTSADCPDADPLVAGKPVREPPRRRAGVARAALRLPERFAGGRGGHACRGRERA